MSDKTITAADIETAIDLIVVVSIIEEFDDIPQETKDKVVALGDAIKGKLSKVELAISAEDVMYALFDKYGV
jgi:hypothetical protein